MIESALTATEQLQSGVFTKQDLIICLIGLLGTCILGALSALVSFLKDYVAYEDGTKKSEGLTKALSYATNGFFVMWVVGSILLMVGQRNGWLIL